MPPTRPATNGRLPGGRSPWEIAQQLDQQMSDPYGLYQRWPTADAIGQTVQDIPYRPGAGVAPSAGVMAGAIGNQVVPAPAPLTGGAPGFGPPEMYANAPDPAAAPGAASAAPRTEQEYWAQKWAIEMADREAARAEQTRQFNVNRQDQQQAQQLQAFGGFGGGNKVGPAAGAGIRVEQTQVPPQTQGAYNGPVSGQGIWMPNGPATPYGKVAPNIQGSLMGKAPSGGAGGPHAQTNAANAFFDSTVGNPQGEESWQQYEDYILQNSPRGSMLQRGEDAGVNMTPVERAYLAARRRRQGGGGQVRVA
jgi:hypothetical protein